MEVKCDSYGSISECKRCLVAEPHHEHSGCSNCPYGNINAKCVPVESKQSPDRTGLECGCASLEHCAASSTCSGPSPDRQGRTFSTKAYRDGDTDKLRYTRGLCPTVQTRYMEFLQRNRLQSNGEMRDFDNWKKGIPANSYIESLGTHFWCVWEYFRSFKKPKLETGDIVDDLCAMRFNIDGLIHELLKARHRKSQRFLRELTNGDDVREPKS